MKCGLWIAALSTVIRYGSSHSDDRWYRVCGAVRRCAAYGSDASRHRQAGLRHRRACQRAFRRDANAGFVGDVRVIGVGRGARGMRAIASTGPSGYVFTIGSCPSPSASRCLWSRPRTISPRPPTNRLTDPATRACECWPGPRRTRYRDRAVDARPRYRTSSSESHCFAADFNPCWRSVDRRRRRSPACRTAGCGASRRCAMGSG